MREMNTKRYPHYLTSKPLRENVRLLGDLLGEVIREIQGDEFFQRVERTRRLSKKARTGDAAAQASFNEEMRTLRPTERALIAKAFTEFLRLANLAEQTHRVRRRRAYERKQQGQAEHTLAGMLRRLLEKGTTPEMLGRALSEIQIDLVLTAHPTETLSIGAIRRYRRIHTFLQTLDDRSLTPDERARTLKSIRREILTLWLTGVVPDKKPSPAEEAQAGLELVDEILWESVGQFHSALDDAARSVLGKPVDLQHPPIRFGSWMGGDRDGNPHVTAAVTADVLHESLRRGRGKIRAEIELLQRDFDFSPTPLNTKLQSTIAESIAALFQACARLEEDAHAPNVQPPVGCDLLLKPLTLLRDKLSQAGLADLARPRLDPLLWRLRVFGLALLSLDIRQEASRHAKALEEVFGPRENFISLSEAKKIALLDGELSARSKRKIPSDLSPDSQEVLETMRLFARFPKECFGSYVISMAEHASDLLAVEVLMKWVGVSTLPPIAPLFETPDSLRSAIATLEKLWMDAGYRARHQHRQEIMLGYSDSSKRSGRFASSWAIHQVQKEVLLLAKRLRMDVVFFHGRGGSIDRGGGPILTALQALPRPLSAKKIRVTEQGESIFVKFGLPEMAQRTFELYLAGFLEAVTAKEPKNPPEWDVLAEQLAQDSEKSFRAWIYERPEFTAFFARVTPAAELSLLKIGSRPARRGGSPDLESLRAIPWVFAWTQTRGLAPAWLGMGEALSKAVAAGHGEVLRRMYLEWPFFQSTIGLVEMSLAKVDLSVFRYYVRLLGNGGSDELLAEDLVLRLESARAMILEVTGHTHLLENRALLARSIRIRNPYVDILNVLQAHLLREYRSSPKGHALETALAVTIAGVSAGMRNTG